MFINYLISALRSVRRQKVFSIINLFGLSVAMAAVILIYLWIHHELSYDSFHKDSHQIYRVEENQFYNNERYHVNVTPWPSGPVWETEIPEIETAARYTYAGSLLFRRGDQNYYESGVISADSGFFRIFSFDFVKGNPDEALHQPNSIVINQDIAEKYFGDADPLGEVIQINNAYDYTVTGVIKKVPGNSSIRFEAVISFDYVVDHNQWYSENWGNNSIMTYIKLVPGVQVELVNQKLTEVVNLHKENNTIEFLAAPLERIHLYSYFGYGMQQRGIQNIYIFSIVGLFVLVIACINFMNLTTARASSRSKEIGIRKVNGAQRKNLILQFLGESMILTLISFLISIIIVLLLIPAFNHMTGKEFSGSDLADPVIIVTLICLVILTGLLSGTYPAFYLSSLIPVRILKQETNRPAGKAYLRKITVIIQFSLTIILIIATTVIYNQLTFMQNKSLGYVKENLIYIPLRGDMRNSYNKIREELSRLPEIENITASAHTPHNIGSNSGGVDWEGKDPELELLVTTGAADYDFIETMKIKMKSGRSFSRDYSTDAVHDTMAAFIINEEMERIMGVEDAVGMRFHFMGMDGPVIGVIENYHYQSARNLIEPIAFVVAPTEYLNYIIIRLSQGDVMQNINKIKEAWSEIMPLYPFDYRFLDDEFDQMYRTEERMGRLMSYFSLIAIIISCVGLFGLSVFTAEQKTKEVGIRKVFGSGTFSILKLFSREIVILLSISALISWPLAWYVLKNWLQNFDYRTELNPWIFLAAGALSLLIALLSISYQTIRAANRNPAVSLRYE